jgi:glutamate racemase
MPRALSAPTILVFDSGLGGLTVFREVAKARPDARFIYVADDALFPYGAVEAPRLIERVVALMEHCIAEHQPDLVVIACNTASTLVLPALRRHFAVPFIGTVPAIKPACAGSLTRHIAVLGTEATVKREYTQSLIQQFAGDCRVTLVGSARLAGFAEAELAGAPAADDAVRAEIAPCFAKTRGARIDTVVLACTHYPLLAGRMRKLAPWDVNWIDPAPAIARRVTTLAGLASGPLGPEAELIFTSGRVPSAGLARKLREFGLRAPAQTVAAK